MNKHHEALNRMVIEDNTTATLEDGAGNVLAEFGKPSVSMAAQTMTGDLMACLIDEFKSAPDVWQKMPEHQQQDLIYRVQQRVQENIRQAVEIIASDNRPTIVATVESVTVKDGIKAVVTLPKSDAQRHELFDAAGMPVLLIVGGAADVDMMVSRFLGWRLPDDFAPDNGVSYTPIPRQPSWTHDTHPTGTNLLHAGQARAMFEYILAAAPEVQS